jgi:hypothetical protein
MEDVKNNFIKTIVVTALFINLWIPSAKAVSGQDVAIKMGLSIAGAIAGKSVNALLFPSSGVDYKKIRQIMEEVTRKVTIEAEISTVEGELRALNDYISSALHASGVPDQRRFDLLYNNALRVALVVDRASGEFFAKESISTYLVGAQVELAALSSAYFFAKEAKNIGDMAIAMDTFRRRLVIHYEQMEYVPLVQKELTDRRVRKISCSRYGNPLKGYKWWLQDNDWSGVQLIRNWYRGAHECWGALNIYKNVNFKKYVLSLNERENFGWIHEIERTWFKLGLDLDLFTQADRLNIVNTYEDI